MKNGAFGFEKNFCCLSGGNEWSFSFERFHMNSIDFNDCDSVSVRLGRYAEEELITEGSID